MSDFMELLIFMNISVSSQEKLAKFRNAYILLANVLPKTKFQKRQEKEGGARNWILQKQNYQSFFISENT